MKKRENAFLCLNPASTMRGFSLNRKPKKAQITIFVILGVLLVGAIIIFFLIPRNVSNSSEPEMRRVYSYVNSLIEEKSFDCFRIIGERGGYYEIPEQVYVNGTSYWYYNGVNTQPFINTIEEQIAMCVDDALRNSTGTTLEFLGDNSLRISSDRIKTKVKINEWRTIIEVDYPVSASGEDSMSLVSSFNIEYKINLLKIYEIATGIVNYASIPEFDRCNPSTNCRGEDIDFSFFSSGDDLFVRGQSFAIASDSQTEEPFELRFAIKRQVTESFGKGGKKLAVLYQDDGEFETFGKKSLDVLKNISMPDEVDYYDCAGIPNFISKIDEYDAVMITGNLQFQILRYTAPQYLTEEEIRDASRGAIQEYELFKGCDSFNLAERKSKLKNWVNSGGILWINDVNKFETDSYIASYLGYLGYKGGEYGALDAFDLGGSILRNIEAERGIVSFSNIVNREHQILTCPNDLREEIVGTWRSNSLKVSSADEIIIGDQNEAVLWTREMGAGLIVFDEFLLKSNIYASLSYEDDLYSKGIAEKYFLNVLNYLAVFKEKRKIQMEISLISPLNDIRIDSPVFYFNSQFGKNDYYDIVFIDKAGVSKSVQLEGKYLAQEGSSGNRFRVNLTNNSRWDSFGEERYEWQISLGENYSNIGSFIKNISTQGGALT